MKTRSGSIRTTIATLAGAGALLAGSALVAAPATAAPTGATSAPAVLSAAVTPDLVALTDATLVASWYATFLHRSAAADPGSRYWVQQLDDGVSPTTALASILQSPEHVTSSVTAIYRAYLDAPLGSGAQQWINGVVTGQFPLEWVEQNVATSSQYQAKTGASRGRNDVAVEGWYSVTLNRSPGLGERSYWGSRIDDAGSLQAFRELWYASETVDRRTQLHYRGLLGRSAGSGELAYRFPLEVRSDISVVAAIGSSPEYVRNAQR